MQECIFLWNKGLDVYNGDVCTQPPLLILLFSFIPEWALPSVFIGLDIIIAAILYNLASFKNSLPVEIWTIDDSEESVDETIPIQTHLDPEWVSWIYLLNPYSIMACSGKSLGILCNVFVLSSIYMATNRNIYFKVDKLGNLKASMSFLSIASYLGLYPILLLPATLMYACKSKKEMFTGFLVFAFCSACLLVLSTAQVESWNWLNSTYKVQILASDLSPNIGLWWYFFIQVFNTFRIFFVCLFQFLVVIFVMPISLKFR